MMNENVMHLIMYLVIFLVIFWLFYRVQRKIFSVTRDYIVKNFPNVLANIENLQKKIDYLETRIKALEVRNGVNLELKQEKKADGKKPVLKELLLFFWIIACGWVAIFLIFKSAILPQKVLDFFYSDYTIAYEYFLATVFLLYALRFIAWLLRRRQEG